MPSIPATRLRLQIVLCLMLCFPGMAAATPPCRGNTFTNAKVVVEARVKSLSIGRSGLLIKDFPPEGRMIRVDLEVVRVIKGKFADKEVTLYGIPYPPPERFLELSMLAQLGGLAGNAETFEWELSASKINDDVSVYSLNRCNYSKFSDEIDFRGLGDTRPTND